MTCMKQEFCIHEKYCQRHIGQNFDSCILFSRNSKPMTEQEYLQACTTEQLAEWIADRINEVVGEALTLAWEKEGDVDIAEFEQKAYVWVEWLKQPHQKE